MPILLILLSRPSLLSPVFFPPVFFPPVVALVEKVEFDSALLVPRRLFLFILSLSVLVHSPLHRSGDDVFFEKEGPWAGCGD